MERNIASIIVLCLLSLASCQVDQLVPCDTDPAYTGLLCREYRYAGDQILGTVEYSYAGDSIIRKEIFDQNAKLLKSTIERYANGLLQTVAHRLDNGNTTVATYHYLSNDSLECIVYGAADSSFCLHYADGKRDVATTYHGTTVERYHIYRYHQTDGKLFRISFFDGKDKLKYYHTYEHFYGNRLRIDHHLHNHVHLGYWIMDRTADGTVLSAQFTDSAKAVTHSIENTFDADGVLTETREEAQGTSRKNVFFYH